MVMSKVYDEAKAQEVFASIPLFLEASGVFITRLKDRIQRSNISCI